MRPSDTRAAVCSTQGNFFCFFFLLFVPRPLTSGVVRAPPPPATGDRNPGNSMALGGSLSLFFFRWHQVSSGVFLLFLVFIFISLPFIYSLFSGTITTEGGAFFCGLPSWGSRFVGWLRGGPPPTPIRPSCTALSGSVVQAADPRTTHIEPLHVV